jgi:uncharacterized repeat protein (TIGR01451 family)
MKSSSYKIMLLILFFIMILSSISALDAAKYRESSVIKNKLAQTWIPPEPDNNYYSEDLDISILKDGSVLKEWNLVDHGIGDISFPINLTTPVNSSTLALEDLRVRLAVVQHDEFSQLWGPITYQDTSYEFLYDDGIESIISHLFLEFYVLLDNSSNDTIIYPLLEQMVSDLESLWTGITFLKFGESFSLAGRRITQTWRAFPTSKNMRAIFEDIITNNFPSDEGLFVIDNTKRFLDANHKSLHLVANWDGVDESGSDSYDQEPYIDGTTENFDERWEFIAGISLLESEYLSIDQNSINNLQLKDVIPYTGGLTSHPNANDSNLNLNLFHGSEIIAARPKFESSPRYKTRYSLDMLSDSGEGADYILPDYAHVNFTDGMSKTPVLTVKVTSDKYNIMPGEYITLTYEVSNIGEVSAYDVYLEDNFNYGFPVNYSIVDGDPDNDYTIEASWDSITAGSSEINTVTIYCNTTAENGSFLWIDPDLEYHSSNYADENIWARNPRDYGGGYQIDGSEVIILCDVISPILLVKYSIPQSSYSVGDLVTVELNITNVGNNATDLDWRLPVLGINTSAINGYIDFLDSSESIIVESSFLVDYPERFFGSFFESRFFSPYSDAYVDYNFISTRGAAIRVQYANEIPVNIYPQVRQTYGALIQLSKSITDLDIEGENIYQVTITAKNVGDTKAFFVDITDNYPIENFSIISGTNSITWDLLLPNMQFSYSFVVSYPETIASSIQVSYVTASYDFAYNWYSGSSWEGTYNFDPDSVSTQGALGFLIGIGFILSTAAAISLGLLLLREKGLILRTD